MAKVPPPIHSRFKPGQSGNPSGKPKGILTVDEVSSVMSRFCRLTREQLQDIVKDPKSSMIEIAVASILAEAAKKGDPTRLEFLLLRSIGRVKEHVITEEMSVVDALKEVPKENIVAYLKSKRPTTNG